MTGDKSLDCFVKGSLAQPMLEDGELLRRVLRDLYRCRFHAGIEYSGIFKYPWRATTCAKLFRDSDAKVTPYNDVHCVRYACSNPSPPALAKAGFGRVAPSWAQLEQ